MQKFYFDVTETFIKTIAIEADSFEQASERIKSAYHRKEFKIGHEYFTEVEFVNAQEEVEKSIKDKFIAEEELETFNCNDVVYDDKQDHYICPVCGNYVAERFQIKDLDYDLPKYCSECGTKLHY